MATAPSWADSFDSFNTSAWSGNSWLGGWNGEFSFYVGSPSNRSGSVAVEDGILYLQPDLTSNYRPGGGSPLGWQRVLGCGRNDPAQVDCPDPADTPSFAISAEDATGDCSVPWDHELCNRTAGMPVPKKWPSSGESWSVLPPVTSASIRTRRAFSFGRLEIRARLPRGDWLWPALWLLPEEPAAYGGWPRSGEIDVVESRGNAPGACGPGQGRAAFGSTLHWGPDARHNGMGRTHTETVLGGGEDFSDGFHVFGLEWGAGGLYTYLDDPDNKVLSVPFDEEEGGSWERGAKWGTSCFRRAAVGGKCELRLPHMPLWSANGSIADPWTNGSNAAPFDKPFFLQVSLPSLAPEQATPPHAPL